MNLKNLKKSYEIKKDKIKKRLYEFKEICEKSERDIFAELCFCLCTPQSKATVVWKAIESLVKNDLLYSGNKRQIIPFLNKIRFTNKKSEYIIEARKFFTKDGKLKIKDKILKFKNPFELREWLVKNIKGFGMKEASHFIRNVGLDNNQLVILDRHILKNLKKYGTIKKIPICLAKERYLNIEKRMKEFSKKIGITLAELDLLFWSEETNEIFK